MMLRIVSLLLFILVALGDFTVSADHLGINVLGHSIQPANAQSSNDDPVAIIEDIKATDSDLAFMDFVFAGDTINLKIGESLRLAYLQSCVVEEFMGGTITVGDAQSNMTGGSLQYREEVDCDSSAIAPTEGQGQDVAGIVFRAPDSDNEEPLVIVYSTAPIFTFTKPVKQLVVRRVDPGFEEEHRFQVNGRWLDLVDERLWLATGGLYRAETETESKLLRVSRKATAASSSVISRLVGF